MKVGDDADDFAIIVVPIAHGFEAFAEGLARIHPRPEEFGQRLVDHHDVRRAAIIVRR